MKSKINVFWFRRDLRLDDNVGLYHALSGNFPVMPMFIFDQEILDKLPKNDARVTFIFKTLQKLNKQLREEAGSSLALFYGTPQEVFKDLLLKYDINIVFTNNDYEPYALKRDATIRKLLLSKGIALKSLKDNVILEKKEVVKDDGAPYVVYTPYKKKWKQIFNPSIHLVEYKIHFSGFIKNKNLPNLTLEAMGYKQSQIAVPGVVLTQELIKNYGATRNFPSLDHGTSRLGPHLRFGTVSIRKVMAKAISEENEVFWNELIWREFFMQILWHFPVTTDKAFKPKYDRIEWRNNAAEFERWKNGQTGYPLVDAGMRQLKATGYMHNRVRMVVASFLCKHLLIDWRWGEAYFAEKLLDFDLASNVGNWQWAAGSGVDAAPYFRIFNPTTQAQKFDKQGEYVGKWVPELQELTYPPPMVEHKLARERCLKAYSEALD